MSSLQEDEIASSSITALDVLQPIDARHRVLDCAPKALIRPAALLTHAEVVANKEAGHNRAHVNAGTLRRITIGCQFVDETLQALWCQRSQDITYSNWALTISGAPICIASHCLPSRKTKSPPHQSLVM